MGRRRDSRTRPGVRVAVAVAVAIALIPTTACVPAPVVAPQPSAGAVRAHTVPTSPTSAGSISSPAASALLALPTDLVRDREYWLDDYGIRDAWSVTRGAGTVIAVIDTGVDAAHPDLRGAVVGGADFSGLGSADGLTPVGSDGSEHGTLVASLAAGRGETATSGVIGAAPEAGILSVSIGFDEGDGGSDEQIAEAVRWAVDNGADVINMSLTRNTPEWPRSWDDAFLYAADKDVVVVAAAGNRGSGTEAVGAPATMPGVLTVAGVDRDREASADASAQGITIGVAAPSEQLVGALPGGGRAQWSGTSGAAPIVAGVVALVRAAHPDLNAASVIDRVVGTAVDAGDPGPDYLYGFGVLDAAAAVTADRPAVETNPMGDLRDWIRLYRRAASEPTAAPEPTAALVAPSDATDAAPWDPVGSLLPEPTRLALVGLPLLAALAVLAAWAAVAGGVLAAVRRARARR